MKVVAFSYEIGSFGKPVAMDLAQNADMTFVPFSVVYKLALERNERFRRHKQDVAEGRGDIDMWEGHFFSDPSFLSLFEAIVLELAAKGNSILIGAAVQAVLKPFDGIIKVHLRAPLEVRVKRFTDLNGITVSEANLTVKWWDQRRRALFEMNSIFEGVGDDVHDLIINTDRVSIPAASRLLQALVKEFPSPPDQAAWRELLSRHALAKRVECAVREVGSALGLAPLEVRPSDDSPDVLNLSGFVHTEADAAAALKTAQAAAEGRQVQSQLKQLRLHGDMVPPSCWR